MAWIRCGRLGRPHGVRGEVRLWPDNPETSLLQPGRSLQIGLDAGSLVEYEIERVRFDARGPVVKLAGVDDRDAAAALTGRTWFETREAFGPLDEDEWYVADLVGLPVRTEEGRPLGRVEDVWDFGGGDILVVRDGRDERLIPFAADHVTRVDPAAGEIVVRSGAGSLDEFQGGRK